MVPVSNHVINNNSEYMDSYNLLEISGSESDHDIIHFASFETSNTHGHPKKKRLKRKERDQLRSSGSYINENVSSINRCQHLCSISEAERYCCRELCFINSDGWEFFRSLLLVVSIVGLSLITWLALHLQSRVDILQTNLFNVEASGSELPAKFHESHVRLQQLEKNHTALWSTISTINSHLEGVTEKLKILEASMKILQDSFSESPQLSSLPKDVATIQESVAAFGSSLQDVQSAVKAVKEEQGVMHNELEAASSSLSTMKSDVSDLYNSTQLPIGGGREGIRGNEPINSALLDLKSRVVDLSSSVSKINGSIATEINGVTESNVQKIELSLNTSLSSLRARVDAVESTCNVLQNQHFPSKVANMSVELSILKESSGRHYKLLQTLTQSLAVVKGVEKKLEGSQLQMSSLVGDLQNQLNSHLSSLNPSASSPNSQAPNLYRLQARSSEGSSNHPRKKRRLP